MKIIKQRVHGTHISYHLEFQNKGNPNCGASFPCDPSGNVYPLKHQAGRDNLAECLTGLTMNALGVVKYEQAYTEPAIGECNYCRRHVTLSGFTNTCECGADYNSAGQGLAPRSQWGEETGETASEILGYNYEDME